MNPRTPQSRTKEPAVSTKRPTGAAQRPTTIGPFSGAQSGSNRTRRVPAPWIDCALCAWRHYPSASGGTWYIATACVSCGAPLVPVAAPQT